MYSMQRWPRLLRHLRYADALVLAFMLINVKHYIMNPQKVFQNFLNPTLPNAEGMEALDQVLEEVEAFYQACLTRRVNNTPRLRHLALLGCVPLKVELHLIYLRVRASFLWRCFLHVCQASLDSCMMNYSRFTVPRASSQNYDGTPADGSAKPMKGSGKQEIPVSEWTPQRLDHMPTREELEVHSMRSTVACLECCPHPGFFLILVRPVFAVGIRMAS